ncbi:MAG: hypothetical protein VX672_01845 [Planctomycetota bacterium]|nr:hypothetical protein [Planctomycetota bacterium]
MTDRRCAMPWLLALAWTIPAGSAVADVCAADVDRDGLVGAGDLGLLISAWGPCGPACPADVDGDDLVGGADLAGVLAAWGERVDRAEDCDDVSEQETLLFAFDADLHPPGVYTEEMLERDWNDPTWSNGVDEGRVSIVEDAEGARALQVSYPKGSVGTSTGGAQWKLRFAPEHRRVRLRYRLRFGDGFDFVRGGKLPGLIGGAGNTGGGVPTGEDGWSARLMWREEGAAEQYVYHPDQPANYGDRMPWTDADGGSIRFEPSRWYEVEHEIGLNTPGLNDGSIRCRLDGRIVLERSDLRFRDIPEIGVDQLYFSTFFGGSSSSWASVRDEVVWFDDFEIVAVESP